MINSKAQTKTHNLKANHLVTWNIREERPNEFTTGTGPKIIVKIIVCLYIAMASVLIIAHTG